MPAFVAAGAGFLLAVLWFDLMFDVQARGRGELSGEALDSISAYYARVTTAARPMNRLVALVMLGTLAALVAEVAGDHAPRWAAWTSLALVAGAVTLAAGHTVPAAVRLGARGDDVALRRRLARGILRDHLACLAAIAAVLAIQLAVA